MDGNTTSVEQLRRTLSVSKTTVARTRRKPRRLVDSTCRAGQDDVNRAAFENNWTMTAAQSSRHSSCTDACVRMGVNYSATYGTAPLPRQRTAYPSRPAALTLAATAAASRSNAGSLMNDFRKSFARPTRFPFRLSFHSSISFRHRSTVSRPQVYVMDSGAR